MASTKNKNDVQRNNIEKSKVNKKNPLINLLVVLTIIGSLGYLGTKLINFTSLNEVVGCLLLFIFTVFFAFSSLTNLSKKKGNNIIALSILFIYQVIGILNNFSIIPWPSVKVMDNFINKNMTDVVDWASSNDITLEQDYEYSDLVDEYCIISQSVLPGTKLKNIDKLVVAISEGPNPYKEIVIPNMVGWDCERVLEFIKKNHLTNVNVNFVQSDKKSDTVIEQNKSGNLKRNEELVLTFSFGEEREYKTVKLDDLTNKTKFEAEFYLKSRGIKYEIKYDFSDKIKRGKVMAQSIKAGKTIDIDSDDEKTLFITISKGPKIVIPDLTKMSVSEITEWVVKNKLRLEFKDKYDESIKENNVISSSLKKGDVAEEGETITITLSKGALKMKDFESFSQFREWADNYGILYEEQHEFSSNVKAGEVISYSYKKGQAIKNNDSIIVKISDGEKLSVPNVVGLTKNDALSKLRDAGLNANFVYKYSDNVASGKAISQSISSGSSVSEGTTVTVTLSNGPAPKNNNTSSGGNSNSSSNTNSNPTPTCDTSKGAYFFAVAGNNGSQTYSAMKAQNPGFTIKANYVDHCTNGASTSGMVCGMNISDGSWVTYCKTITVTIVK